MSDTAADASLSGLCEVHILNPGFRSQTRSNPGFLMAGLRPLPRPGEAWKNAKSRGPGQKQVEDEDE